MKILKMALKNFQGIKEAEFAFDGRDARIYGENGAGKTTVFNAHCWLLFGRSGSGIKGYNPKTNDPEGDYQHNLEHSVEEEILIDRGAFTLKKVYKEVWTKARGSNKATFDRNTVDFYINGVPVKEFEYEKGIEGFANGGAEGLKILSIPDYFPKEMKWEDRRRMLMELCPPVDDFQIVNMNPELSALPVFLKVPAGEGYYNIDEYLKIASARKAAINNRIRDIPGRIDDARLAIPPDTEDHDYDQIREEVEDLRKKKADLEIQFANLQTPEGALRSLRAAKEEIEKCTVEERAKYNQIVFEAAEKKRKVLRELSEEAGKIGEAIAEKKVKLVQAGHALQELAAKREKLLSQYEAESSVKWSVESETCPTCKRPLDSKEVARLREEFNLNKSIKLEKIREEGKKSCSADTITEQRNIIGNMETILKSLEQKMEDLKIRREEVMFEKDPSKFEDTEEGTFYAEKLKEAIKHEQEFLQNVEAPGMEIKDKIRELDEAISKGLTILSGFGTKDRQLKRIEELSKEEKTLGEEFQKLEQGVFLCEEFMKAKANFLTEQINSKFSEVRFRLFITQINGGVREDCEVMIPSPEGNMVPYSDANDAAKVNAGIEIIKVFSEKWGLFVPLFIDNAERITEIEKTKTQMIQLVVSKGDYKLRTETEEGENA